MLQVEQFLTSLAKEGVVVKEKEFLHLLKFYAKRRPVPPVTHEQVFADDSVPYSLTLLTKLHLFIDEGVI